jgi:hypothetical protein
MGKYEPLSAHLDGERSAEWAASFAEVERVLGFPLPASARRHREWWSNQAGAGHSQARGWQDAGWQVWKVDLGGEKVVFRRRASPGSVSRARPGDAIEELFSRASAYLETTDRDRIVQEALKALCEREAARRLARLGGTMPELEAPPRRRFGR